MYASSYLEPAIHDILAQDPTPYLRKMRMPVLALTGTLDTETPAALPALRAQLQLVGNTHVTTLEIPQVNHFFQTNVPGQEKPLFENPETFSPAELRLLSGWLTQQVGLLPKRPLKKQPTKSLRARG